MSTTTAKTAPVGATPIPLDVRLEALNRAIEALTGFPESLTNATIEQLARALGALDKVAVLASAGRVAVAAARTRRSAPVGRLRTGRTADWIREHAPSQRGGHAGVVARAADLVNEAEAGPLAEAVLEGCVAPAAALSVMNAFHRVRDRLADSDSAPAVLQALLDTAQRDGAPALNAAVTQLLQSHGTADAVRQDQHAAAQRVRLSHGIPEDGGTTRYDLIADAVSRAILEAAIQPLSRPVPGPDGSTDPRSAEHRRGQALFEVCRRVAHAAAVTEPPCGEPAAPNTTPGAPASNEQGQDPSCPDPASRPSSLTQSGVDAAAEPHGKPSATRSASAARPPSSGATPWWNLERRGEPPRAFTSEPSDEPSTWAEGQAATGSMPDAPVQSSPVASESLQRVQDEHGAVTSAPSRVPWSPGPINWPISEVPTGVKAVLFVTLSLHDLICRTGTASTVGSRGSPTRIDPESARRLACDAGIIPVVLGNHGEILDLGRQSRLFSYPQTKALWLRDEHCTYPGCDVPAFWTDAHHLRHWADGGASDLSNAALLCGRHHDTVHRERLAGSVRPDGTGVDWDLTPGSYAPT